MNKVWHAKHPMPSNATLEQRVRWHRAHFEECACRPVPKSLLPLIREKTVGRGSS
jgi:hypothetical protein